MNPLATCAWYVVSYEQVTTPGLGAKFLGVYIHAGVYVNQDEENPETPHLNDIMIRDYTHLHQNHAC